MNGDREEMKTIGYFVLAVGIIWLIVALNMDTSVSTGYGRVNNIGLMASKQNHIMLGGFIAFCGLMMSIFGKSSQDSTAGTVKCPFCAEQINPAAIKCKHCGSEVKPASEITSSNIEYGFNPSNLPFDSFFIRRKVGFDVNDHAVMEMVNKLKRVNPGVHPMNIQTRYADDLEKIKNKLPSSIMDEFEARCKYWLNK